MTEKNDKSKLRKRTESFAWRLSGMIVVAILAWLVDPETVEAIREAGIHIPASVVAIASLVVGEITKYLNGDGKEVTSKTVFTSR